MSVVPHKSDVFCLSKKLDAQQNTRMYFVGQDTDVHFSSGVQGQAKAKIVVPVVRVVVVPFTDDAVLRVIVPTTATYDAFSTGSSTLLMSLPFNISTAFNLQSNRNGIIVFVELLRKNPVWTLSDFVKIQKFSSRIVKKCTSCTFFNSKFVKQTCYCVEPRTSCPIVVVPPFFQNHTAPYGTFLHCVDALHKTRAS